METYKWETKQSHANNTETMYDFLYNELENIDGDCQILMIDGTYAEIENMFGVQYEVHASGDGDSTHHKVEFVEIESR